MLKLEIPKIAFRLRTPNSKREGVMEENWLLKMWRKMKKSLIKTQANRLTFDYPATALEFRRRLAGALAFWKLIRERDQKPEVRRETAQPFLKNNNPLVRLVAMIEQLPDLVWRRILWRYNIDFANYESFFRRLNDEQRQAIQDNWQDLFVVGRVPRAFSWWEIFVRRLTPQKLLTADTNNSIRYRSKQAWSFNLRPFDIGFNAYSNGENNDASEFHFSTKKFLSAKKHADDFVVDREFGLYWWLYRSARSNFAYRPDKLVEMKRQICPGFWYTLFIHLWFWVVSPILFITMTLGLAGPTGLKWYRIVGLAMSWLTPGWILSALCRLAVMGIMKISGKKKELVKKIGEPIVVGIVLVVVCSLILGVLFTLGAVLIAAFGMALGAILTALILITIGTVCYSLHCLKERDFDDLKKALRVWFVCALITAITMLVVLKVPVWKILSRWFIAIIGYIWGVIVAVGIFWLLLLIPAVMALLILGIRHLDEAKQEKIFLSLEKYLPFVTGLAFALFIVYVYRELGTMPALGFASLMVGSWIGSWMMLVKLNPIRAEVNNLSADLNDRTNSRYHVEYGYYQENSWLMSLGAEEKYQIIERAALVIQRIFGSRPRKYEQSKFGWLIARVNPRIVNRFEDLERIYYQDSGIRYRIFELICLYPEMSFRAAMDQAAEEERKREGLLSDVKSALRLLGRPFMAIGRAIKRGWQLGGEMISHLKFLYDLYNKRCPFVAEQRRLY
jgi:hypothetical protein